MILDVKFEENNQMLDVRFGEIYVVSDGGYDKGYEEGKAVGYAEGHIEGYAQGETDGVDKGIIAERKAIFSAWQKNGYRNNYTYACYMVPMIDNYFYPQHNMKPVEATAMFRGCTAVDTTAKNFDLVARLNECGVTLDFSKCESLTLIFAYAQIGTIPTMDFSAGTKAASITNTFIGCYAHTIEKIIFKEVFEYKNTFDNCSRLANLTAEGVIANDINFSWSPLTAESAISIIRCLKPYADTDEAFTRTIYFSETTIELLEAEGMTADNGGTWFDYIYYISGWNIG